MVVAYLILARYRWSYISLDCSTLGYWCLNDPRQVQTSKIVARTNRHNSVYCGRVWRVPFGCEPLQRGFDFAGSTQHYSFGGRFSIGRNVFQACRGTKSGFGIQNSWHNLFLGGLASCLEQLFPHIFNMVSGYCTIFNILGLNLRQFRN